MQRYQKAAYIPTRSAIISPESSFRPSHKRNFAPISMSQGHFGGAAGTRHARAGSATFGTGCRSAQHYVSPGARYRTEGGAAQGRDTPRWEETPNAEKRLSGAGQGGAQGGDARRRKETGRTRKRRPAQERDARHRKETPGTKIRTKKGNPLPDSPSDDLSSVRLPPHAGRRGGRAAGRQGAISSRAGRSTRASSCRP